MSNLTMSIKCSEQPTRLVDHPPWEMAEGIVRATEAEPSVAEALRIPEQRLFTEAQRGLVEGPVALRHTPALSREVGSSWQQVIQHYFGCSRGHRLAVQLPCTLPEG